MEWFYTAPAASTSGRRACGTGDIIRAMRAGDVGAFLKANPVFAGLPTREIDALASSARVEAHRARDYIFLEGDAAHSLYIVQTGRVKIVKHSKTGKDVVLEMLGAGEVFGGVAVFERRPYPAAAQAVEACTLVVIPGEPLIGLAERHPSIIKEMALMIGRRLRSAHDSVKSLAVDPVEARLASTLLRLAEREGSPCPAGLVLPFHLTRQSLADMTGTTVETTIRVVSRWIKHGVIADDERGLVLRNVAALRDIAEGQA